VNGTADDAFFGNATHMKFDPARALMIFDQLGDPRFAGPDGEARVAEFVMERFQVAGWEVERREVTGSPWPQRLAPWVELLGYAGLVTAFFVVVVRDPPAWIFFAVISLSLAVGWWVYGVASHRIRLRRRRDSLETAPVIIASSYGDSSAPVRVIFQAVLGSLVTDYFRISRINRSVRRAVVGLILFGSVAIKARTLRPQYSSLLLSFALASLVLVWVILLNVLYWDCHQARSMDNLKQPDRRALAVLTEMIRTWQRAGSQRFEAVFVAAGGQRLDYTGSREVVRLLESEWPSRPSLMVLFIAPGAGVDLALCTRAIGTSGIQELAEEAAASLWIPILNSEIGGLAPSWPFEKGKPAVVLMGSDPNAFSDASVDPQALHRAAQLATEIALRWAKKQHVEC
jgi:hypothetical protein